MLEDDCDNSDIDGEGVDEDELEEIQNEAAVDHFNAVLVEAQVMAVNAEHEVAGEKRKRKGHYMGNSARTKRHHAQNRHGLVATGQRLISSMLLKKSASTPQITVAHTPEVIEVIDEDSDVEDGQRD